MIIDIIFSMLLVFGVIVYFVFKAIAASVCSVFGEVLFALLLFWLAIKAFKYVMGVK